MNESWHSLYSNGVVSQGWLDQENADFAANAGSDGEDQDCRFGYYIITRTVPPSIRFLAV